MSNNFIDTLIEKIKSRTNDIKLTCSTDDASDKINLSDHVIIYSCGNDKWKIIPLDIMLRYSLIYDIYTENDKQHEITVVVCPLTLQSTVFFGIFTASTYIDNKMVLYENATKSLITMDSSSTIDSNDIISKTKRLDIKIMTFRDALIMITDACIVNTNDKLSDYLISKDYYKNTKNILDEDISDLIHPKTLTYIIQYKSLKGHKKFSILLGKDVTSQNVTGYNMKQSGTLKYLSKFKDKIINREGYLMPMMWYMAKTVYESARVIYINQ